jgi:hypothetical protein
MNWLFPGFLAGAALIALPVVLHFLRHRQNVVVRFPSLRFLAETARRDTRRHQLLRWLTLLLRCLAIALVCGAFARPFWESPAAHRQLMVVALDNSMSMQTAGRWEKLQGWALKQVDDLRPGDQAALLVMNPAPVWLVPLTDDLDRVRATLKNARPGYEKTRYAGALQMAGETLATHPGATKTLVWLADEQRTGWRGVDFARTLPAGVKTRFADAAPEPARQAAITSLQWSLNQPGLEGNVRLFTPLQEDRHFTVSADGRVLAEKTVTLHNGDNPISLPFTPATNAAGFRVAMDPDDLPADDAAWIPAAKPAADVVLLDAVPAPDFLAHALNSTETLGSAAVKSEPLPEKNWPANAVVVLRGDTAFSPPQVTELNRFFDAGGALWIFMDGSAAQLDWLKQHGIAATGRKYAEEAWHLQDWDPDHPMLAAFAGQSLLPLLSVEFHQGFNLAGDQLAPVADWPDGQPALAEWADGNHRLLLAGFPLTRAATDWPTQPSLVPFVHQTARWLGAFAAKHDDWRVGDTIPLPAATGTWRWLDGPVAEKDRPAAGSVRPAAPGLYEFDGGGARQVFAVNTPAEESDLAPWPKPEQFAALESKDNSDTRSENQMGIPLLSSETAENQQRLWWWILAGCGLILLAELALANRTAN